MSKIRLIRSQSFCYGLIFLLQLKKPRVVAKFKTELTWVRLRIIFCKNFVESMRE